MFMQPVRQPEGGDNKFLSGDVPEDDKFSYTTIEKSIEACKDDPRFRDSKAITRVLHKYPSSYQPPPREELQGVWESIGLKVYPYNEGSAVQIPAPFLTFEDAFPGSAILKEIEKNKFEKPSAVQSQVWPVLMAGTDCVGVSQTGSGKTLAFLLPAFLHIDEQYKLYSSDETKPLPSVLVLTPTRELAQQIELEVKKYSYNNYKSVCLYGGAPRNEQIRSCRNGVEIIIATPGRLADLAAAGVICLATVSYVVLDEADRMLDMGFEPSIRRIMFEIRPDRLVALTSATWPESVRNLAQKYTKDAVMVVSGTLDLSACKNVVQYLEFMKTEDKFNRIIGVVNHLNETYGGTYKMIVFVKSKALADHLSSELCLAGIRSQGIHGGRSQQDRENTLADLRKGRVQILIATDLVSRGIDIPDITHVVNYDFPGDIEEYVHRVGRTGRAGKSGEALSLMTWQDRFHAAELITILEKSNQNVPPDLVNMAQRYAHILATRGPTPRRGGFQRRPREDFQSSY